MPSPRRITVSLFVVLLSVLGTTLNGCARLPETTRVLYEGDRVVVKLETDPDVPPRTYTSPTDITNEQLTNLLRRFSVRAQPHTPIRLLADDEPPRKLFREMELDALVPVLREALQKVGFRERVRFEVLSPGRNPRYWRDATGGWIKVRDHYFHLCVDYFHVEQPIRKSDAYYPNYPVPRSPESAYTLYFEPIRVYVTDPLLNESAVDLDLFIATASP